MLASLHLVDGGMRARLSTFRQAPTPDNTPGLRSARLVMAGELGRGLRAPQPSRWGLVAMWDEETALDRFLTEHPLATKLDGGLSLRLAPLRAVSVDTGHYPGVPNDIPTRATDDYDGPVAVLTIGRLRLSRTVPFLRTSAAAEAQVVEASGVLWSTALINAPERLTSTFSLWENAKVMRDYATGTSGHSEAIRRQKQRSFHHAGSFIRFRPYAVTGSLSGRNPLSDDVVAALSASDPKL